MDIKIKLQEGISKPLYATKGSAGFDLLAIKLEELYKGDQKVDLKGKFLQSSQQGHFFLRSGERALISTGVSVEVPEGYELQIRSRSGISLKRGIIVANSPGTIDSDYRGTVGVILLNTTPFLARINFNEAIAQAVLVKIEQANFIETKELSTTERGEGGFGHTSVKYNGVNF